MPKTFISFYLLIALLAGCVSLGDSAENDKNAYLGGILNNTMKKTDREQMNTALESIPTGKRLKWYNPDTGREYIVTLLKTYFEAKTPCRSYKILVKKEGETQTSYGNACRVGEGIWRASFPLSA